MNAGRKWVGRLFSGRRKLNAEPNAPEISYYPPRLTKRKRKQLPKGK